MEKGELRTEKTDASLQRGNVHISQEKMNLLEELRLRGVSTRKAAQIAQVHHATVERHWHPLGGSLCHYRRHSNETEQKHRAVVELWWQGFGAKEIEEISRSTQDVPHLTQRVAQYYLRKPDREVAPRGYVTDFFLSKKEKERIVVLYHLFPNLHAVSEVMHRTKGTVAKCLRKNGVIVRTCGKSRNLRHETCSLDELAGILSMEPVDFKREYGNLFGEPAMNCLGVEYYCGSVEPFVRALFLERYPRNHSVNSSNQYRGNGHSQP